MKVGNVKRAAEGAVRFLQRVNAFLDLETDGGHIRDWPDERSLTTGLKESGALRRASLDLTRALAEMRKP